MAATFTELRSQFPQLEIGAPGAGGGVISGGNSGGIGGTNINLNVPVTGTSGSTGSTGSGSTGASGGVNCQNPFNFLAYPSCWTGASSGALGSSLLRIALFLLGLIAIIGAIYLYRGSNPILAIPAKAAKGVTHAAVGAAKAALSEGGE